MVQTFICLYKFNFLHGDRLNLRIHIKFNLDIIFCASGIVFSQYNIFIWTSQNLWIHINLGFFFLFNFEVSREILYWFIVNLFENYFLWIRFFYQNICTSMYCFRLKTCLIQISKSIKFLFRAQSRILYMSFSFEHFYNLQSDIT